MARWAAGEKTEEGDRAKKQELGTQLQLTFGALCMKRFSLIHVGKEARKVEEELQQVLRKLQEP